MTSRENQELRDADTLSLTFMVISIVRKLYQMDNAKGMYDFFVHILEDRFF